MRPSALILIVVGFCWIAGCDRPAKSPPPAARNIAGRPVVFKVELAGVDDITLDAAACRKLATIVARQPETVSRENLLSPYGVFVVGAERIGWYDEFFAVQESDGSLVVWRDPIAAAMTAELRKRDFAVNNDAFRTAVQLLSAEP